jgi:tetratricopeptide (TPR) repeat protein
LEISKERQDKVNETDACIGLGHAYRLNSQFQMSVEHFEKALGISKERGDKYREREALVGLGDAYKGSNQFQTAVKCLEKALEIVKEDGHKSGRSSQRHLAIECLKKSLKIAKESESDNEETRSLLDVCRFVSELEMAIGYFETALEIVKELTDNEQEIIRALLVLGHVNASKNRVKAAIEYFKQALDIAKRQEYTEQERKVLRCLADAYDANKQFEEARQCHQEMQENRF